jgi:uncharacterized protein (DUF488 family)
LLGKIELSNKIFTIGHSDLTIGDFVDHLLLYEITALVDVRSSPYSRSQPQYNKEFLKRVLQKNNISYVSLGKELGARSEQPECYKNGKVQFDILEKQPLFLQGISRVIKGLTKYRIALMCAEKDPLNCHRTILVSRHLYNHGIAVNHILYNGLIETHSSLEKRLLECLKIEDDDLFLSYNEIIAIAYKRWGERVAYVAESPNNEWLEAK